MSRNSIVAWGRENAYSGALRAVRAEVEAEFAERFDRAATIWERWRVRREFRAELHRRAVLASGSPESLY